MRQLGRAVQGVVGGVVQQRAEHGRGLLGGNHRRVAERQQAGAVARSAGRDQSHRVSNQCSCVVLAKCGADHPQSTGLTASWTSLHRRAHSRMPAVRHICRWPLTTCEFAACRVAADLVLRLS